MALDKFRKINITLNKANQRVLETQIAKSGDVNGRELVVQITNNGVIEDQTGTSLKLNWQHENGKQGSTNFKILDIKTGKFSVYYPKEMLYKGKVNASIEITSNGQITNSMNFKIIVQADVFDGEAGNVDGVFISLAEVNKKLDDREKEYVELKERQMTVETQFNSIQQELTDTDIDSAPEIIAARGGEQTLSDRLDKEQQEVTAQLAETAQQLGQADYVDLLKAHNKTDKKLLAKRTSSRNFEVLIPLSNGRFQRHLFVKDANDDFIKHGEVSLVEYTYSDGYEMNNYTSIDGSGWVTGTTNQYTTTIGDTFTFEFTGTGLDFYAFHDTRGGLWEFVIDDREPIMVSTHINTATGELLYGVAYSKKIVDDLTNGPHTLVATFKGADPENPSTTPRGWVYHRSADQEIASFRVHKSQPVYKDVLIVGGSQSNKEFAISAKPEGATYGAKFIPDHGDATALPALQKLSFDGDVRNLLQADADYVEVSTVRLTQVVNGIHPNAPADILCSIHIVHTINSGGVNCKVKVKFLKPTLCTGYVSMFPSQANFAKKMLVSNGLIIDVSKIDGSTTDVIGGEFAKSYAYLNDVSVNQLYKDTVFAMSINDVNKTFRNGKKGRKEPNPVWVHHRTNNLQKLYPEVLSNVVMQVGDYIESDYTMYLGQMDFASDLLLP